VAFLFHQIIDGHGARKVSFRATLGNGLAVDQKVDVFRDVRGVIANTLDVLGAKEKMNAQTDHTRVFHHVGEKLSEDRVVKAIQIFILPPSRAELEARLRKRGSDSDEAIARRLGESVQEMSHWNEFDYVIVNRDFEQALGELEAVFEGRGEASRRDRPELAALARELLGH